MSELPFDLAAEDFLSPEDMAKLEKMTGEVFKDFAKLSIDDMRQSPIFREIEAFMYSIQETMRDYFAVHRLTVDNRGNLTVFSYCAFMGDDVDEDVFLGLGNHVYSPKSVHVVVPMHLYDGAIFKCIALEPFGVGIPCAGTVFYPTAPEDGHSLSQLERDPQMLEIIAQERESFEEPIIGRGFAYPH